MCRRYMYLEATFVAAWVALTHELVPHPLSPVAAQNNLMEFHSLLDFACPGLLDDRQTFKRCFEVPITIGSDKSATHRWAPPTPWLLTLSC